jgi:hypothetical protein
MTPEQFCYWLQGRAELMPETPPSAAEWKMIGEHLATVFKKVTPAKADESPLARAQRESIGRPQPQDPYNPFRLGQVGQCQQQSPSLMPTLLC